MTHALARTIAATLFLFGIMFSLGNALLFEMNTLAISLVVTIVGGSGLVILRRRMALGAS